MTKLTILHFTSVNFNITFWWGHLLSNGGNLFVHLILLSLCFSESTIRNILNPLSPLCYHLSISTLPSSCDSFLFLEDFHTQSVLLRIHLAQDTTVSFDISSILVLNILLIPFSSIILLNFSLFTLSKVAIKFAKKTHSFPPFSFISLFAI